MGEEWRGVRLFSLAVVVGASLGESAWNWMLPLPLPGHVSLGQPLKLSGPQDSVLKI